MTMLTDCLIAFIQCTQLRPYAIVFNVRDAKGWTQRHSFLDAPRFRLVPTAYRLRGKYIYVSCLSTVDWLFRKPSSGNMWSYCRRQFVFSLRSSPEDGFKSER